MRSKFSKIAFVAGVSLTLAFTVNSCASKAPQVEPAVECQASEFRGVGIGENESEALTEAHSALAKQINSSVNVTIERIVSQQISNGKEDLHSGYESKTVIESALPNAHDARIVSSKRSRDKINITVCMSKADAAKGFLERQRQQLDSLGLASNTALNTEHPKQKNEAWQKTKMLYNEFMRIQLLLEGWEVKSPYSADEIYSKAREDYKNYCKGTKIFWQDAGNECSETIFAMLSKKVKMEKSKCSNGLMLSLGCSDKCKSSSFGVECSYEPSIAIESCGGEKYSMLKAKEAVTGSHEYNKSMAKENLIENLSKASFLNEWEKEIMEWMPKCVE